MYIHLKIPAVLCLLQAGCPLLEAWESEGHAQDLICSWLALFWTDFSGLPGICLSHFPSFGVSAPITTGATDVFTSHTPSSSSFSP